MEDNNFEHDGNENPLLRLFGLAYGIFGTVIAIVGFCLPFILFPQYVQRRKQAKSTIERCYWNTNLIGTGMIIYSVILFVLVNIIIGPREHTNWFVQLWPSVTDFLEGKDYYLKSGKALYLTMDALMFFFVGFAFWIFIPRIFGDWDSTWQSYEYPDWYMGNLMLQENRDKLEALKKQDPRVMPGFTNLRTEEQVKAVHEWEAGIQQVETGYKDLKRLYNR